MLTGVLEASWDCQAFGEGLYTGQNKPLLQGGIKVPGAFFDKFFKLGSQCTVYQKDSYIYCHTVHLACPYCLNTT